MQLGKENGIELASILDAVAEALDTIVAPHLADHEARTTLDLALRLIRLVAARDQLLPSLLEPKITEAARIVREASDLLEQMGKEVVPAGDLGHAASDRLSVLAGLRQETLTREQAAQRRSLIAAAVACERKFLSGLDQEAEQEMASVFERGRLDRGVHRSPKRRRMFDREHLEDYFRSRGGDWASATVSNVRQLPGGFGKETTLVEIEKGGQSSFLVIRRDLPATATGTSVVDEFPMLHAAFRSGVSVAEPLWLEDDMNVIGQAFLVSVKAAGINNVESWRSQPLSTRTFLEELAENIVLVQQMDVSQLSKDRPTDQRATGRDVEDEIERWYSIYASSARFPSPLLEATRSWLSSNIPAHEDAPVLVHGDIGFHNMLMEDGRITAVLDWEFAHVGDAQEDLNYVRPFIEQITTWKEFLECYTAKGGVTYRPEDAAFWRVFSNFRNGAGSFGAVEAFKKAAPDPDIALKLAVVGFNYAPRFCVAMANDVVAALD